MLSKITSNIVSLGQKKASEKLSEIDSDEATKRIKHYVDCMSQGNVEGLFSALLEDMDKDKILNEVDKQQGKFPELSPQELSVKEIDTIAKAMSAIAMGSGLSWVIPGISLVTGPLATAGELVGIFVYQSRLVVKISAYHGMDISLPERARDIAVCVAGSTLGKGTSLAATAAINALGPKLAEMAAQKMGQTAIKAIPGIGSMAGILGGAVGSVSNYYAVKGTGYYALKMYGDGEVFLVEEDSTFDKSVIYVAMLMAQADGIITDEEKDFIKIVVDNSTLSDTSKQEVLSKLINPLSVADIQGNFTEQEKKQLIIIGHKSCMADGYIDSSELTVLFQLASHLGLEESTVNELIESYSI